MNTITPERKAMLTEDLRLESIEMVDLLGVLERINDTHEDFFHYVYRVFEHFINTKPQYAAKAFDAYSQLTDLFRIAALRRETLGLKISEYRVNMQDIDALELGGYSLING